MVFHVAADLFSDPTYGSEYDAQRQYDSVSNEHPAPEFNCQDRMVLKIALVDPDRHRH